MGGQGLDQVDMAVQPGQTRTALFGYLEIIGDCAAAGAKDGQFVPLRQRVVPGGVNRGQSGR